MSENLTYNIIDSSNCNNVNMDELMAELNETDLTVECEMDQYIAYELDYKENYTVKMLGYISDYYEINKRKLRKDELVQEIVLFEQEPQNKEKVQSRKKCWFYINELKKDKFFSKYLYSTDGF